MTILITGAGLVGLQAARYLVDRGESVVLYDIEPRMDNVNDIVGQGRARVIRGDIQDPLGLIRAVRESGADRIIHTVAHLPLAHGPESPYLGIQIDLMGTVNVLEVARLLGVRRVVLCSSGMVYSVREDSGTGPLDEDSSPPTFRQRPDNSYGISKFAAELYGFHYMDYCGLDFAAVRFSIVFGPMLGLVRGGQGLRLKGFLRSALAGQTIDLKEYEPWQAGIEMVYSRDAGRSVALASLAEKMTTRVYNISMGRTYTLGEMLDTLRKLGYEVNTRGKAEASLPRPAVQDVARARQELGFVADYDLEAAFRDYLAWLKAHPE